MRKIENEEIKQIELSLLKKFHEICDKHNLKYTMFYGTLLGAIRHKGFIPWDDDIDVAMPRKDYEKLIQVMDEPGYKLIDCRSNDDYYLPFGKFFSTSTIKEEDIYLKNKKFKIGIDIDVFALDSYEDCKSIEKIIKKNRKYVFPFLFSITNYNHKNFKNRIVNIFRFFYHGKANKISKRLLKNAINVTGNYLSAYYDPYLLLDKEVKIFNNFFDDLILLPFENHNFYAPKNYDEILKTLYGDYMKFPPVEERITHHDNNMYVECLSSFSDSK